MKIGPVAKMANPVNDPGDDCLGWDSRAPLGINIPPPFSRSSEKNELEDEARRRDELDGEG